MERERINEMWKHKWENQQINWHLSSVNFYLKSYFERMVNGNVSGKRILVPLCGASNDLAWLHEQGLAVVGIELSAIAIEKFFNDHGLTYSITESPLVPGCKVFSHDSRLQIFQVDLFQVSPELLGGKFNYWLDRGALVAMAEEEQQKYADLIMSLMSPDARCFMEAFEYDPMIRSGPPRPIYLDKLLALFRQQYEVEELERLTEDKLEDHEVSGKIGYDAVHVYYLLKKQ